MDIKIAHGASVAEALQALGDATFDFVSVHANCIVAGATGPRPANIRRVHGATSCLGAMTGAGKTDGVAAFAIADPEGGYGTGMAAFEGDPRGAATRAVQAALADADRL
ncbi:MAG: hypothetical protein ACU0DW_15965, partial [Shimia sp.]